LIDKWVDQGPTTYTAVRKMTAGSHKVVVEHYENTGGATIKFSVAKTTTPEPQPSTGFARGHSSHGKSTSDLIKLRDRSRLDCYRDDALFESINPTSASPNWSYLDSRWNNCKSAGYKTFLVIACYGSKDPNTYAANCAALARRYGNDPALRLMIEVWNEPYMPTTYVDPSILAAMCAAAVKSVKGVNSSLLIGPNLDYINYNTAGNDYAINFVSAYPSNSIKPDFVASHPYSDPQSIGVRTDSGAGQQQYRFDRILKLRDTLAAKGWSGMPMLASEWGWSSASVGETNQASFARQGFELLKSWGVIGGYYYTGDRANTNASDNYSQFGILRSDGSEKPAVAAIGQAVT